MNRHVTLIKTFIVLLFFVPSLSLSQNKNKTVSLEFKPTHTVRLQTDILKSTDGSIEILKTLYPGEKLQYLEDEIYYHRVLLENGLIGYITDNDIDYNGVKKIFPPLDELSSNRTKTINSNENIKKSEDVIINQVNIPKTSSGCTNIVNTRFPIYSSC